MAARRDAGPRSKDVMDDKDPRLVRSRNRLVDAASALLKTGGVDAVTVGAVSRMSRVARTTFYRHFDGTTDLLAAAFERLLPHADVPDAHGPIRDSLVRLVRAQAALIEQAPLQLTALAWLAMVPEEPGEQQNTLAPLRARVIAQYREPFDQVLQSAAAQKELDEFDPAGVAITQLVGPLVFARLSGLRSMSGADCEQLVDDFLAAHRR
jgi:AcrR family transcriptional regulator